MKPSIFVFLSIFMSCLSTKAQTCSFSNMGDLGGQPTNYSGNTNLDQALTSEYYKLVSVCGIMPFSCYIYENGDPNAFASTQISHPSFPDGTVVLGLKMIQQECSQSRSGTCVSMAVVMAHEFAHILDFKNRFVKQKGKMPELFADYMAGVYLHTRELTFSFTDIKEAAESIFSKGDYSFNDPQHHGTPQERMDALLAGYNFSRKMASSGKTYFSVNNAMQAAKTYLKF
jgi:hypothetical protein